MIGRSSAAALRGTCLTLPNPNKKNLEKKKWKQKREKLDRATNQKNTEF